MNKDKEHISVLADETIKALQIKPDGIYVDCTLGYGGHSKLILEKLISGKLFALDQDSKAIAYCENEFAKKYLFKNYKIIKSNFRNLNVVLNLNDIFSVDGIIFDLGVSSPQLDTDDRGFSFHLDGDLDMRMDQTQILDASKIVNTYSLDELSKILFEYGEEKFAKKIASKIVLARNEKKIKTTLELVNIIKSALPNSLLRLNKHPARKTFQALRIAVNDELNCLVDGLEESVKLLNSRGVLAVITFHSLEDRIVKKFFKKLVSNPYSELNKKIPIPIPYEPEYNLITKKSIVAANNELKENPRSRSAHLRIIQKK